MIPSPSKETTETDVNVLFLRHTQTPTEAKNRHRAETAMRRADLTPSPAKALLIWSPIEPLPSPKLPLPYWAASE